MSSSKFNSSSPSGINAGNSSPLRARLQAALDAYDKENEVGPSGTPPKSQTSRALNRHSLPGSMNTYSINSPFNTPNRLAAGLKAPLSIRGRLSEGGMIFNQGAGGLSGTFQWKPTGKRSASMAEMDEPSSPPKRPRREDINAPFVFIQNSKLLHEDNILARRMFLDLVEAQDKRAVYGGHNPKEICTMGPSIDPKDLFDKTDASLVDRDFSSAPDKAIQNYTVIQESEGDSIFGGWFHQLLTEEDAKDQQNGAGGSSQKGGDLNSTNNCDIPPEGNRADVAEATAGCETNGNEGSPTELLPPIEAATDGSPLDTNSYYNPPSPLHGSKSRPKATSTSPPVAQGPSEVVPEVSHSPKANEAEGDAEKKRARKPKAAKSRSTGVIGSGIAGPSTSTSRGPFAYPDARAQGIWELAQRGDYLGAHGLFDPLEQVILIKGQKNVQSHLEKDPKLKKRLEDSPEGPDRECLYLCGASAIWKRIGNPKHLAVGQTPKYKLTYKRCKNRAYATVDNYKKHVYRHHLHKYYKVYKKEAGEDEEEKEESVKGKGKAPQKRRKAKAVKKEDDDYEEEDEDELHVEED